MADYYRQQAAISQGYVNSWGDEKGLLRSRFSKQYKIMGSALVFCGSVVFLLETCYVATMIRYQYGFFSGIWAGLIYIITGVMALRAAINAVDGLLKAMLVFGFLSFCSAGCSVAFNLLEVNHWFRAWYQHEFTMGKGVVSVALGLLVMVISVTLIIKNHKDVYGHRRPEMVGGPRQQQMKMPAMGYDTAPQKIPMGAPAGYPEASWQQAQPPRADSLYSQPPPQPPQNYYYMSEKGDTAPPENRF